MGLGLVGLDGRDAGFRGDFEGENKGRPFWPGEGDDLCRDSGESVGLTEADGWQGWRKEGKG